MPPPEHTAPPAPAETFESVRALLGRLLGGLAPGDAIGGFCLEHIDIDEGLSYRFRAPGDELEVALGPRDDAAPRYAQSRSFNVSYQANRAGRAMTPAASELLRTVVERLVANDDGRAAALLRQARPTAARGEIRRVRVDSLLCPTRTDGLEYYTANPYVGCLIGCSFCYIQPRVATLRRLAVLDDLEWGQYVLVKENAPEVLDAELTRLGVKPVVFSPLVADVYQPLERKERVTRRCLEVLARHGARPYVLTRSTLVLDDTDLFAAIPGATVGFSIPTDRDDVRAAYEPRAAPIDARFAALARLREAGVRTVAVVAPILAMDVLTFAERLASVCDAVRIDAYQAPSFGSAPLVSRDASAPPPPADPERVRAELAAALVARGVSLWTTRVPP